MILVPDFAELLQGTERALEGVAPNNLRRAPQPLGAVENAAGTKALPRSFSATWYACSRVSYRAFLQRSQESVQDLELSAQRRLHEAWTLAVEGKNHTAIYLAGLSAEMLLKTACFFLAKARPGDLIEPLLGPLRKKGNASPFRSDFESGHGLWFWSQELLARRQQFGVVRWSARTRRRYLETCAALYADWFIGMRYRPGSATQQDATVFLSRVDWIANNHGNLRS
jgi:hypothetical protein